MTVIGFVILFFSLPLDRYPIREQETRNMKIEHDSHHNIRKDGGQEENILKILWILICKK